MSKETRQPIVNCEHMEGRTFIPHKVTLIAVGRFRRALDPHPDQITSENSSSRHRVWDFLTKL